MKYRRGSVLVMVIWLLMIMVIFGVGLANVSRADYRLAKFRVDRFASSAALDGLAVLMEFDRMDDETPDYDTLGELSLERTHVSGKIMLKYSLVDEERKININHASQAILEKLPAMNKEKASAIINSKLRPFQAKEELLQLDEIDIKQYKLIEKMITVYGDGGININTCSKEVMLALGMKEGLIEIVERFRKGEDGILYSDDDGIFKSVDTVISDLKERQYLSLNDEQQLALLVSTNLLITKSKDYQINAQSYAAGKVIANCAVVIGQKKNARDYSVKAWLER